MCTLLAENDSRFSALLASPQPAGRSLSSNGQTEHSPASSRISPGRRSNRQLEADALSAPGPAQDGFAVGNV
eukprot:591584-Hanusia_phi.AAC.1